MPPLPVLLDGVRVGGRSPSRAMRKARLIFSKGRGKREHLKCWGRAPRSSRVCSRENCVLGKNIRRATEFRGSWGACLDPGSEPADSEKVAATDSTYLLDAWGGKGTGERVVRAGDHHLRRGWGTSRCGEMRGDSEGLVEKRTLGH